MSEESIKWIREISRKIYFKPLEKTYKYVYPTHKLPIHLETIKRCPDLENKLAFAERNEFLITANKLGFKKYIDNSEKTNGRLIMRKGIDKDNKDNIYLTIGNLNPSKSAEISVDESIMEGSYSNGTKKILKKHGLDYMRSCIMDENNRAMVHVYTIFHRDKRHRYHFDEKKTFIKDLRIIHDTIVLNSILN